MKTSRSLAHSIAALLLAPSLHAADRFWIDDFGGPFTDINNWSASDGGAGGASVPGVADVVNFTLNDTYTVTFAAAVTNTDLDVEDGNVTFDLGGFTYTLSSGSSPISIGNAVGQTGRLTVKDGTLGVDTNGDDVYLGTSSTGTGFLTISTDGHLGTALLRPSVYVGLNNTGTLTVNDNGRIDGTILSLGTNNSSTTGTVAITGPNAVADFSSTTIIGANGSGTLTVSNGGTLTGTGSASLGSSLGSDGTATVSGAGSSWTLASTTTIGSSGDGTLTISSGGLVSSATTTLGSGNTGVGTATVTGAGSQWNLSGLHTIGSSGLGVLTVSGSGRIVSISSATLGLNAGGEGRATVTGAGSQWMLASLLTVGSSGAGELTISAGGEVSSLNVTIGSGATGSGEATVTGAGSRLIASGNLFLATSGNGTLRVASGGEVYIGANFTSGDPAGTPVGTLDLDGGAIYVGGNFSNSGVLDFTNGLLQVAGNFQPNPALAPFTVNGALGADLPTLELVGSGTTPNISTLIIGSTRRGELRLREGRAVTVGAINIGLNAGSSGSVNVESGASLTTTGTLSVGGNGATPGGTGTLTIDGGSVDIGFLRLHSGGTIHLESGLFAADSLFTMNGTFHWTGGEVRLDAASTQLDDFLAVKLLGPAKTLRAGQTLSTPFIGGQIVEIFTGLTVDGGTLSPAVLTNIGTVDLRSGIVGGASTTTNSGVVLLGGPLAQLGTGGGITNNGTIRGSGQLIGALTNAASGRIDVISGERLILNTNAGSQNAGTISVIGGELQVNNALTNAGSTGLISAREAILRFNGGVTNNGSLAFSNGTVDVYGDITQNVGGRITISNGGIANFYDDVVIQPGAASVQATAIGSIVSRAVFFGSYNGGLTGGGTAFIEGDHRPGNSPALITFGGDVVYGTFAELEMELGGTARGTQYDALNVAGNLAFNGALNVPLFGAFQPAFGNVFNLFDFGSRTGTFSTVTLPAIAPGLTWSQANLYTAGEIQIALDTTVVSRTWDGGGGNNNWITDANWTLDVQPLNNATADLIFTGNVRLTPSVDTPWNVLSITFNNAAGAFTITGPQGVTIGAGGIVNSDADTQTITAAVTLSASESFTAAAGDLVFANVAIGAHTLTVAGANDVTLDDVTGTGTITKTGAGDLAIIGTLGAGAITLNANAGDTFIAESQTLAALSIGAGATVTLGAPAPAALAAVPEPGSLALVALGALGFARRPR